MKPYKNNIPILFQLIEVILTGIIIIIVPIYFKQNFVFDSQYEKSFLFFIFLGVLLIVTCLKKAFCGFYDYIKITIIDVLLIVLFSYISINNFFISKIPAYTLNYYETISLFLFYFIIRSFCNFQFLFLFVFLMLSGIIQSIYAILQLYDIYPSHHSIFKITGGFLNPGPFSGYISSIYPVALVFYLCFRKTKEQELKKFFISFLKLFFNKNNFENKKQEFKKLKNKLSLIKEDILSVFLKYISLSSIFFIIIILPATQSRAAWTSVVIITFIILFIYRKDVLELKLNKILKKLRLLFSQKLMAVVILIMFFIIFFIGLYFLKPHSASGRLLIWKVTFNMFVDKIFTGHGFDKFEANYMIYQASYFIKYPESKYISLAGDNIYAFNEFLKIGSELGIIGLLIFLSILYFSLKGLLYYDNYFKTASKTAIISILIFGLFSYPFNILAIKINFIFFLAVLSLNSSNVLFTFHVYKFKLIKPLYLITVLSLIYFFYQPVKDLKMGYDNFVDGYSLYQYDDYEGCLENYKKAYDLGMKYDGTFMVAYGKALSISGYHQKAIEILNDARLLLNNTILYTALGDSYKALNQYDKAEKSYLIAHNMAPDRFYPLYLLAKLYDEINQGKKAYEIAEKLINKQPKVPSQAVDEIKRELRNILSKYKNF